MLRVSVVLQMMQKWWIKIVTWKRWWIKKEGGCDGSDDEGMEMKSESGLEPN